MAKEPVDRPSAFRYNLALLRRHEHTIKGKIEAVQTAIVWRLPRWLIYWAVIRAGAHATTGKWGNEHPDSVSVFDILKRWEQPNERY